jgi:hypothetical protein
MKNIQNGWYLFYVHITGTTYEIYDSVVLSPIEVKEHGHNVLIKLHEVTS